MKRVSWFSLVPVMIISISDSFSCVGSRRAATLLNDIKFGACSPLLSLPCIAVLRVSPPVSSRAGRIFCLTSPSVLSLFAINSPLLKTERPPASPSPASSASASLSLVISSSSEARDPRAAASKKEGEVDRESKWRRKREGGISISSYGVVQIPGSQGEFGDANLGSLPGANYSVDWHEATWFMPVEEGINLQDIDKANGEL